MRKITTWYEKSTAEDKKRVARQARTSVSYLRQVAKGHRRASAKLELSILVALEGEVRCPTCGGLVAEAGE